MPRQRGVKVVHARDLELWRFGAMEPQRVGPHCQRFFRRANSNILTHAPDFTLDLALTTSSAAPRQRSQHTSTDTPHQEALCLLRSTSSSAAQTTRLPTSAQHGYALPHLLRDGADVLDIEEQAPSSLCELFADDTCTAPKKKQEKMNLGEFLTNQCMHTLAPSRGARCTRCDICACTPCHYKS